MILQRCLAFYLKIFAQTKFVGTILQIILYTFIIIIIIIIITIIIMLNIISHRAEILVSLVSAVISDIKQMSKVSQ